ncbi:glucosaminidase domain-containing protein [Carnobacterium divergens]|uniref:glucosaminidase domain-containing protein n=1 Tax=Carnobacterium divergens TaxID=2748 RepID=UPI0039C9D180
MKHSKKRNTFIVVGISLLTIAGFGFGVNGLVSDELHLLAKSSDSVHPNNDEIIKNVSTEEDKDSLSEEDKDSSSEEDKDSSGEEDKDSSSEEDKDSSSEEDKDSSSEEDKDSSSEEDKDSSSEEDKDSSSEEDKDSSGEEDKDSSSEEDKDSSGEEDKDSSSEEDKDSSGEEDKDSSSEEDKDSSSASGENNQSSNEEKVLPDINGSSNETILTNSPNEDENLANVQEEVLEDNYYFSVSKNQTTEEFIETLKDDAQDIAWKNDLYASVMIAQAILETGSGNSTLSSAPNYNLFGVKGEFQGSSVVMQTSEDDGGGNLFVINSGFRKYPSYKESLEDYAVLLKKGISGNATFYQNTWKTNASSYKDVTLFLTGRYATDTRYAQKLNALIETYRLTDYDVAPGMRKKSLQTTKEEDKQLEEIQNRVKSQSKKTTKNVNEFDTNTPINLYNSFNNSEEKMLNGFEKKVSLMKRKVQDISTEASIELKPQSQQE